MSAGISDRKMSRIVTARKVGMMTAQGVNNNIEYITISGFGEVENMTETDDDDVLV